MISQHKIKVLKLFSIRKEINVKNALSHMATDHCFFECVSYQRNMRIVNSNKLPQQPDEMRPFSIPFSATLSNRRVSAKVNTILPQPWIWHPIIQCAFWLCTDSLLRAQGRGP